VSGKTIKGDEEKTRRERRDVKMGSNVYAKGGWRKK